MLNKRAAVLPRTSTPERYQEVFEGGTEGGQRFIKVCWLTAASNSQNLLKAQRGTHRGDLRRTCASLFPKTVPSSSGCFSASDFGVLRAGTDQRVDFVASISRFSTSKPLFSSSFWKLTEALPLVPPPLPARSPQNWRSPSWSRLLSPSRKPRLCLRAPAD